MKTRLFLISIKAILLFGLFFQGCATTKIPIENNVDTNEASDTYRLESLTKGDKIKFLTEDGKIINGKFDSLIIVENNEGMIRRQIIIKKANRKVLVKAERIEPIFKPPVKLKENDPALVELILGILALLGILQVS